MSSLLLRRLGGLIWPPPRQFQHSLILPQPPPHLRLQAAALPIKRDLGAFRFLLPGSVVQAANPICLVSTSQGGRGRPTPIQDQHPPPPLPDGGATRPKGHRRGQQRMHAFLHAFAFSPYASNLLGQPELAATCPLMSLPTPPPPPMRAVAAAARLDVSGLAGSGPEAEASRRSPYLYLTYLSTSRHSQRARHRGWPPAAVPRVNNLIFRCGRRKASPEQDLSTPPCGGGDRPPRDGWSARTGWFSEDPGAILGQESTIRI